MSEHDDGTPAADETFTEPGEPVGKDAGGPAKGGSEISFGLIVFLVIAVMVAVFTAQNTQNVELRFLIWEGQFPLAIIIAAVVAVTVVLDEIMGVVLRRRRRKRLAEKQELKRLREKNR